MASTTDGPGDDATTAFDCTVVPLGDVAGAASLRMRGALDAHTATGHARQLRGLVDDGFVELRIELDELLLCTSDGLDCWDDVQHRLDTVGGHVTLAGATGVVRRVLDVMTSSSVHFCPTVVPAA